MATANKVPFQMPVVGSPAATEIAEAQAAAERYRCDFVDLRDGAIEHDLFRSIPVDLMFRYNFVPLKSQNGTLEIALSDPRTFPHKQTASFVSESTKQRWVCFFAKRR